MHTDRVNEFYNLVQRIESNAEYKRPSAFGIGVATLSNDGSLLDTFFPNPNYQGNFGTAAIIAHVLQKNNLTGSYTLESKHIEDILACFKPFDDDGKVHSNIEALKNISGIIKNNSNKVAVASFVQNLDSAIQDISDAYLRLHLLSHRLIKPNEINVSGIFGILPNVAWTSEGPLSLQDLDNMRLECIRKGRHLSVHSVDKFPRMVDYVIPSGVRIADASRVRLGAYLGSGTTVMHEGFINFNAGSEGPNMIEGRISASVFVKKGTDLGGGCSTMGTLSGGGNVIISVGEDCLIGANAGTGISLGNKCTIEAGLYITAGTKVLFNGQVVKARDLSGADNILFRRNSQTGQIEALEKANKILLNNLLH